MGVTGATHTLRAGTKQATIINWVYDPRRTSPVREGFYAGPSVEDASVVTVNAGVVFDGAFPASNAPPLADLFVRVEWSSGGKDNQTCDFDLGRGSSISFAAARATVYASYLIANNVDPATMPPATVSVTIGRLPSGKRAHRTVQCGVLAPGAASPLVVIPNFAESLIVQSTSVPLVARVNQYVGGALVAAQNVTSSLADNVVPLSGICDKVELVNNGALPARFSTQYLLSL